MATASMKPMLLLASRCRPSLQHNASGWMAAVSTTTSNQFRAFSDDRRGGGGDGSNFQFRRPQGEGRPQSGEPQEGGGNTVGPGRERFVRGGQDGDSGFSYGGSGWGSEPDYKNVRTHMINLFPGEYRDDDETETEALLNKSKQDEEDDKEMDKVMARLHKDQKEMDEQKARWLEASKPVVRAPVIDDVGRSYGRGGRKTAQARVWITPGFGNVTVNRLDFINYFPRQTDREKILDPLVVTRTSGKFDVQCQVRGGGLTGQAGAIRLGVARALQHWNPEYRPPMKAMGYLTRDARKVERKKVGRVKARKRPQWNRR